MALSTQQWLGIGVGAALFGYLLWPKKASAAMISTPATPKTTTPTTTKPYVAPSKPAAGMSEDDKYALGVGNGTAAGNQDAAASRPKDVNAAAARFASLSPSIRESTSYKAGFTKGYNESYDTMAAAIVKKIAPASTEDGAPAEEDVALVEGVHRPRVGRALPRDYGSWYGKSGTFLPSYWRGYR